MEFQSTLFIYEERNDFYQDDYIRFTGFQSTLFIYEERNLQAYMGYRLPNQSFNPLSSFTKREIRNSKTC